MRRRDSTCTFYWSFYTWNWHRFLPMEHCFGDNNNSYNRSYDLDLHPTCFHSYGIIQLFCYYKHLGKWLYSQHLDTDRSRGYSRPNNHGSICISNALSKCRSIYINRIGFGRLRNIAIPMVQQYSKQHN